MFWGAKDLRVDYSAMRTDSELRQAMLISSAQHTATLAPAAATHIAQAPAGGESAVLGQAAVTHKLSIVKTSAQPQSLSTAPATLTPATAVSALAGGDRTVLGQSSVTSETSVTSGQPLALPTTPTTPTPAPAVSAPAGVDLATSAQSSVISVTRASPRALSTAPATLTPAPAVSAEIDWY